MKTLDEVIKKFETCNDNETTCSSCPYVSSECACDADALHYLKEYKNYQDTMCALPDYYEWIHSADNPPLNWEELRTMDGKPVWVAGTILLSHWLIIDEVKEEMMIATDRYGVRVPLFKNVIGNAWQAYRRERE